MGGRGSRARTRKPTRELRVLCMGAASMAPEVWALSPIDSLVRRPAFSHSKDQVLIIITPHTGTSISVIGTSAVSRSANGTIDPAWGCLVDTTRLSVNPPSEQPQNQRPLCVSPALADGTHTLQLAAASAGTPFWVDFLMVMPSPSLASTLKNQVVMLPYHDPAIQYVKGNWQTLPNDAGTMAQQPGSAMFMNFNGDSSPLRCTLLSYS